MWLAATRIDFECLLESFHCVASPCAKLAGIKAARPGRAGGGGQAGRQAATSLTMRFRVALHSPPPSRPGLNLSAISIEMSLALREPRRHPRCLARSSTVKDEGGTRRGYT